MKNLFKTLLALSLIIGLSACSAVVAEKKEDYSNKTLTGMISEIDGTSLTLELGKLKKVDNEENQESPQLPEMDEGQMPQFNEGEMPEPPVDEQGNPIEGFNGERPEGFSGQRPEFGKWENNGEMPKGELPEGMDGQRPELPEDFTGQMPEGGPGQMMEGEGNRPQMPGMVKEETTYTFKRKSGTATIDIKDIAVTLADGTTGTIEDLKIGDVVKITVDDNNNVSSVTAFNVTSEIEA